MAKEVLAALPKIAATGQQLVQVSVDNAKSVGVIFDAAANQGAQEAISTLKEVSAKDLASAGVVVVSTAIDIRATVKEPAYSIPEKALIISADVVYAGAGTFVFATTFTALAALGPIAAVVNSGAGIIKYGAEAAGSLAKHLRYKKELGAIKENIASLDRAIKFLMEDKERVVNLPDLIKDIKENIFKLKELGPDYEKLQQEFVTKFDELEKSYIDFSHTRKVYDKFLTLAKECEITLKEHIQNGKGDPTEIEKLVSKVATLEAELSNNKNVNPDTVNAVNYLKEKCEGLKAVLAEATKAPEDIANLQKAKGSVVTLANGVLRHKKETTIKMANTDPIKLLGELQASQVHLYNAADNKIRQNKRDGWQNVGKVIACTAVLGLAIASLFVPPLAIAVTATAIATSVGFLAFTAYKKYKAYKEKKALKENMAASKSADMPANGLDKSDKNELTVQMEKELEVAQQVEHEHANDLGKLSALISEKSPEPQPESAESQSQPQPSYSAHEVLPGFGASKEAAKTGTSKSTQEEIATPAISVPKNR